MLPLPSASVTFSADSIDGLDILEALDITLVPTSYGLPLAVLTQATEAARSAPDQSSSLTPTPADVAPLLLCFEPWLVARCQSRGARNTYRSDLRHFLVWARGQYLVANVEELTVRQAGHWQLVLEEQVRAGAGRLVASTVKRRASVARRAVAWAREQWREEAA